ncbi:MAG: hypothetical protein P0Y56_00880 [Candidatus Andeanibacterium colombiense]|uniref:Uncharacterized protein n=1 Tax=Candidatus Andeanibacterium colombiense TaxID=3121345 RepID=A0AAJ6BP88_9SPHN|nr:MAG: hypothetical protein P0Y56_00880 [Sphingomonadaceae bacterium]
MADDVKYNAGAFKYALTSVALSATAMGASNPSVGSFSAQTHQSATASMPSTASAGDPMTITHELLEAKLEAVEARTETKFEKLLGSINLLGEQMKGLGDAIADVKIGVGKVDQAVERVETKTNNTRIIIVTTAIAATLTIIGVTYGIIGYGHQVADTVAAAFANGQGAKK